MERLYELPPRIIHELDEELPVGVLGLDNWGYITMGPDRNPDSMPSDGWGLYHPPEYYYYMDPPSVNHGRVRTQAVITKYPNHWYTGSKSCGLVNKAVCLSGNGDSATSVS